MGKRWEKSTEVFLLLEVSKRGMHHSSSLLVFLFCCFVIILFSQMPTADANDEADGGTDITNKRDMRMGKCRPPFPHKTC